MKNFSIFRFNERQIHKGDRFWLLRHWLGMHSHKEHHLQHHHRLWVLRGQRVLDHCRPWKYRWSGHALPIEKSWRMRIWCGVSDCTNGQLRIRRESAHFEGVSEDQGDRQVGAEGCQWQWRCVREDSSKDQVNRDRFCFIYEKGVLFISLKKGNLIISKEENWGCLIKSIERWREGLSFINYLWRKRTKL